MDDRRTRRHLYGLLAAGLTPIAGCSLATGDALPASPQRPSAAPAGPADQAGLQTAAQAAPSRTIDTDPGEPAQQGVPVPGTEVRVPRRVRAGEPLRIHAPPGTRITVRDRDHVATVPDAGMLELPTPEHRGSLRLLVARPGTTALPFVVVLD